MGIIDLHTHSTVSDGTHTPAELAELAYKKNIQAFALTDHDNIGGLEEAQTIAKSLGIDFIPGMEVTMNFRGRKIHVIALGFSTEHDGFKTLYKKIRANIEDKIEPLVKGLQQRGVPVTMEMVQNHSVGSVDRYAVMRCLVSLHIEPKIQTLWEKYIDPIVEEFGLAENIFPQEAFPILRDAGAVISLAHFHKKIGLKGMSRLEQEDAIRELQGLGLDAIEQWYPSYSDDDIMFLRALSKKLHLVATGGTDFHGLNRPEVDMGTGIHGNILIPYRALEDIYEYIKRRGQYEKMGLQCMRMDL